MMDRVYINKRNTDKFIEVRRYADGHYVWKQFINGLEVVVSGNHFHFKPCRQYTGCSWYRVKKGTWHRVSKMRTLDDVLADYKLVSWS